MQRDQSSTNWLISSRLKLRHIRLLLAIDEHRNLNRAAASLNLAQPGASKLLAELEKVVGVSLFNRSAKGLAPTEAGMSIIRHARMLAGELHDASEELAAIRSGHAGVATVGLFEGAAVHSIVPAIHTVQERYPKIKISLHMQTSEGLISDLKAGRIDFAVGRIPRGTDSTEFVYEALGRDKIYFVCRRGHPLAKQKKIELAETAKYPWILPPHGTLFRGGIERYFNAKGLHAPAMVVDNQHSSFLLTFAVMAGTDSIAMMSKQTLDLFASTKAVILPLDPFVTTTYGIMTSKDRLLSQSARVVIDALRQSNTPPSEA